MPVTSGVPGHRQAHRIPPPSLVPVMAVAREAGGQPPAQLTG